jgi:hypothetical protein
MPLAEYPLDERRIRALAALYTSVRTEITTYRDSGWRITSYILALFAGCIALGLNTQFRCILNLNSGGAKGVFVTLLALITLIGIGFVWIAHGKYIQRRDLRNTLDRVFGFCDKDIFGSGTDKGLLQQANISGTRNVQYPIAFTFLIGLAAVVAGVVVFA